MHLDGHDGGVRTPVSGADTRGPDCQELAPQVHLVTHQQAVSLSSQARPQISPEVGVLTAALPEVGGVINSRCHLDRE
jgi:hypothetical protein